MGPGAIVVLAVLAGCGSLGNASEKGRPRIDESRAFPAWETSWVSLSPPTESPQGELAGKVTAIRPPAVEKTFGALRIEAADGTAVELPLAGPGRLALAVGDEVAAKWRVQSMSIHTASDVALVDRDGRVVYASSSSGDATFAPGWVVEVKGVHERGKPHMVGGARRETRWLLLARGDATAMVTADLGARRLTTKDGDFAVVGAAITYSPGKRAPDSSAHETFTIVRVE